MSVVIKVFFSVLVLCTVAVVAVILAIHFRVKRHLRQPPSGNPASETTGGNEPESPIGPGSELVGVEGRGNSEARAVIEDKIATDERQ